MNLLHFHFQDYQNIDFSFIEHYPSELFEIASVGGFIMQNSGYPRHRSIQHFLCLNLFMTLFVNHILSFGFL